MWKKVIKTSYKRRTHVIVRGDPRPGKEKQGDSGDEKTNKNVDKDDINVRDEDCSNSNNELELEANIEKTSENVTNVSDTPKNVRKPGSANERSQSIANMSKQNSIIEVGKVLFS